MAEDTSPGRFNPFLDAPLGNDLREAHAALSRLAPGSVTAREEDHELHAFAEDLELLVDRALNTVAASIGPTVRWPASETGPDVFAQKFLLLDLDAGMNEHPPGISTTVAPVWDTWPLARAARVYARECGWDFAPGNHGIWFLAIQPYQYVSGVCSGAVSGFLIAEDRDGDKDYETLAHIWTAEHWRRRGIATELIRQASDRFPLRRVDNLSDAGKGLLRQVASSLLP